MPPPERSLRLDDRRDPLLDLLLAPPVRDLERAARELDRKTPSESGARDESISLRGRPDDRSRWRERRATAKAKKVATKTMKANETKTFESMRVQRDSSTPLAEAISWAEAVPTV